MIRPLRPNPVRHLNSEGGSVAAEFALGFPVVLALFFAVALCFAIWCGVFFVRHQMHEWLVCQGTLTTGPFNCNQLKRLAWLKNVGSPQLAIPKLCSSSIADWYLSFPSFARAQGDNLVAKSILYVQVPDLFGPPGFPCRKYRFPLKMSLARKAIQR